MLFEKTIVDGFRKSFLTRCDDTGTAYYFSALDFPGLQSESYAFPSSSGHTLQGYFYRYETVISGRLIIFDHGFGGGHRSYMKEIELLCRHGFLVFSYDHTGCMESGGENARGLSQSLCDLNDCLNVLKSDPRFRELDFSVMGHSWGGFSTLNIAALHPEVSHVVVLSGFRSVEALMGQFFGGLLKPYGQAILAMERQMNPVFADFDAGKTLSDTDAQVLLIYSDKDPLINRKVHFESLKESLSHKSNIRFLLCHSKGHNPNYTQDAVAYLGQFTRALSAGNKKKQFQTQAQKDTFRNSWDWHRMTAQDEAVWDSIFQTLDSSSKNTL